MSVSVDQLVKENAILIKDNPKKFFEEKEHLQEALKYMEEESGIWKFKSTVPIANTMNIKNKLGQDNYRMKRIAESVLRKESRFTNNDQTKKWLVIALSVGALGLGVWWLLGRKRRNNYRPIEVQKETPSVFESIMKKPKRKPRKVIKKMIMEEFDDGDMSMEEEHKGLEYAGETD